MFCINCGKQIPDGAKFCNNCGANQNPDTAAAPVEEAKASATPEINLSETFSDYFAYPQKIPQWQRRIGAPRNNVLPHELKSKIQKQK